MDSKVAKSIEEFFGKYRVKKYDKGQILIFNGDISSVVYQLVDGRVKQYDITPKGDEVVLNVFKPPAFFPMSMIINKTPNPYTFQAETDIEVREVPGSDVTAFLKANPEVLYDLLARVYRGMDGILSRTAQLMSGSAKDRLILELVIALKRYGKPVRDGISLELNETELGARTGLSRETVSREMKKLAKNGLVSTSYGSVQAKSIDALEQALGE